MRISVETLISAPPERVFALLIDIPRWPETIVAIIRIDLLTQGPIAVGSRFRETRIMFGREASEEMTVDEVGSPHRLVLTARSRGTAYRAEHLLEAHNGGTRLRLIFDATPRSLAARILTPLGYLMRGTIEKQLAADLADLKRAAELPA